MRVLNVCNGFGVFAGSVREGYMFSLKRLMFVLCAAILAVGCAASEDAGTVNGDLEPGSVVVVSGMLMHDGVPVSGARVMIESATDVTAHLFDQVQTGADGVFELHVSVGDSYVVYADLIQGSSALHVEVVDVVVDDSVTLGAIEMERSSLSSSFENEGQYGTVEAPLSIVPENEVFDIGCYCHDPYGWWQEVCCGVYLKWDDAPNSPLLCTHGPVICGKKPYKGKKIKKALKWLVDWAKKKFGS